ncbi:MAG: hypothetical protein LBI02_10385 [Opitutaceae bacterium]|nr:hypothetical protein [Opitutaceae bacterium]
MPPPNTLRPLPALAPLLLAPLFLAPLTTAAIAATATPATPSAIAAATPAAASTAAPKPIRFAAAKIWDAAPHCAFTDLLAFRGRHYCVFRESVSHVPPKTGGGDGKIRVLASTDGDAWRPLALVEKTGFDLRDAQLTITPAGRLMLLTSGSIYDRGALKGRQMFAAFSDAAGETFSAPQPLTLPAALRDGWLWRVAWHDGAAHGVVYQTPSQTSGGAAWLVKSADGLRYDIITRLDVTGQPNETALEFSPDGTLRLFLRRAAKDAAGHALLGRAAPPYTDWRWSDLGIRAGGPFLLTLPGGNTLLGSRDHTEGAPGTALFTLDSQDRAVRLLRLPSGGDTSYPGMSVVGDELWVSYYSGHEKPRGQAAIYLAKIKHADLFP